MCLKRFLLNITVTWYNRIVNALLLIQPVIIKCILVINLHPDQNIHWTNFDLRLFVWYCQNHLQKRTLEFGSCQELFYTNQIYLCYAWNLVFLHLTFLYSKSISLFITKQEVYSRSTCVFFLLLVFYQKNSWDTLQYV